MLDVALKADHLEAQLTGQSAYPIYASGGDEFFYRIIDARLSFERNGDRKIAAVVLHQNGRVMHAARLDAAQ